MLIQVEIAIAQSVENKCFTAPTNALTVGLQYEDGVNQCYGPNLNTSSATKNARGII